MKFKTNDLEYRVTFNTDKNQFIVYLASNEMVQVRATTIEEAISKLEQKSFLLT